MHATTPPPELPISVMREAVGGYKMFDTLVQMAIAYTVVVFVWVLCLAS